MIFLHLSAPGGVYVAVSLTHCFQFDYRETVLYLTE